MSARICLRAVCRTAGMLGASISAVASAATPVDFARDVYPIFQRNCFECHGAEKAEAKFRLDVRERAFKSEGIIVKGNADESDLFYRITRPKDHDDAMPNRGEPLPAEEIALVKTWIDSGALWPDGVKPAPHWAYVKPVRPSLPEIAGLANSIHSASSTHSANLANPAAIAAAPVTHPVDRFTLARLAKEKLSLAPEADPAVLCRRLHLDLVGLPPSPAEVDAFLAAAQRDTLPRAYEDLVDRLLASPQFGERWARPWLDLARYADSHGYQKDDLRDIWPFRDWVVRALNADMPFDRFTIEQLAGDLLPDPTEAQRVATGFNRCTPISIENGSIPEESRIAQIFDRVNTLGAVWLGTTLECAQCHTHKYDPITHKDYYQLLAFFNNTPIEAQLKKPNVVSSISFLEEYFPLANPEHDRQRAEISAELEEAKAAVDARKVELSTTFDAFEENLRARLENASLTHALDIADFASGNSSEYKILDDKSVLLIEDAPERDTYTITVNTTLAGITGFKLEALTDPSLPGKGPGRGDARRPNFVVTGFSVTASPADAADKAAAARPVRFKRALASFSQQKFEVENLLAAGDDDAAPAAKGANRAWAISPQFGREHWATFECAEPLGAAGGTQFVFRIEQTFGASRTIGRLRLSAFTGPVDGAAFPQEIAAILNMPEAARTAAQTKRLAAYRNSEDKKLAGVEARQRAIEQRLLDVPQIRTLVMEELPKPRQTHVFNRGVYTDKGEPVSPGVPAVFSALERQNGSSDSGSDHGSGNPAPLAEPAAPANRLDLARWLVDRDNPLTARVTVNRWWAELFGRGIVSTVEDFGLKGERPTHPELLDWLAVEFMENGWSMKRLLKTIVTSATYRQSSRVTPELLARDDQNKLYARGPRLRLDAETIRDNALAISGLLSLEQGGPPIRPYQPDDLWVKVGGKRYDYIVSPGDEKYRRGLYVVLKRGAPYPSFMSFDASARMACKVKRSRSNTPLQALTLLNDPVYVEAAMGLAHRVLRERPAAPVAGRVEHAFRLCLARAPKAAEATALVGLCESGLANYRSDLPAAKALIAAAGMGDAPLPPGADAADLAAWYGVATALLNLDETITK